MPQRQHPEAAKLHADPADVPWPPHLPRPAAPDDSGIHNGDPAPTVGSRFAGGIDYPVQGPSSEKQANKFVGCPVDVAANRHGTARSSLGVHEGQACRAGPHRYPLKGEDAVC